MNTQLEIEVEHIQPDLYFEALKSYETKVKNKDLHPVHLVFNKIKQEYFVSTFFKKETWSSMEMYLVVK